MSRVGVIAYLLIGGAAPLVLWMGVKNPLLTCIPGALGLLTSIFCWRARDIRRATTWRKHAIMLLGCASIASTATLFGPYIIVPGLLAGHTIAMLLTAHRRERLAYIALGCLSLIIPVALQLGGVLPRMLAGSDGLLLQPLMAGFAPTPTAILLFIGSLASMVVPTLLVARVQRVLDEAQEKAALHSWHLGKLVPADADQSPTSRTG